MSEHAPKKENYSIMELLMLAIGGLAVGAVVGDENVK